jgi:hypothetical protein
MKKRFLRALFCSMLLLGASLTVVISAEAQLQQNNEITDVEEGNTYVCTVNPNSDLNKGKCRAAGAGQSACSRSGAGTACHGTLRY